MIFWIRIDNTNFPANIFDYTGMFKCSGVFGGVRGVRLFNKANTTNDYSAGLGSRLLPVYNSYSKRRQSSLPL
ncbi:MAG: hypothetical protein JWP94_3087 [Mucilaginibacter sp.]|nr:hypothetical protein [Mucilaginibacter sp.]